MIVAVLQQAQCLKQLLHYVAPIQHDTTISHTSQQLRSHHRKLKCLQRDVHLLLGLPLDVAFYSMFSVQQQCKRRERRAGAMSNHPSPNNCGTNSKTETETCHNDENGKREGGQATVVEDGQE
ncbi:unnamed protein product [Ceratitis capitata]|uniref:(Mediterranean fruit fly) hypothetical protein n=1 Tax=Ceratitis capitata TaxID=7213 RepID=A0A811V1V5_CERCA|nr:unnamed protein product [Ceratitis capitata]